MGLFKNLFDYETKELKKIDKLVAAIEALDETMSKLKDVEIKIEGLQKELAQKIGISECYLSKILNRKKK